MKSQMKKDEYVEEFDLNQDFKARPNPKTSHDGTLLIDERFKKGLAIDKPIELSATKSLRVYIFVIIIYFISHWGMLKIADIKNHRFLHH